MRISKKSFSNERKQNELKQNTALRLRVLRSVLAAGFALSPWLVASDAWAAGGTITRVNDKNTNLMQNGRADIYAEISYDNVGLNRFEQFVVGNNDIANMYFKTHEGSLGFDTLVNTVTNRIDINGTVNALRNNKVGGNMYFLSPKGMVVGAGGVINAGSLTVLTSGKTFDSASEAEKAIKENKWSLDSHASIDIHGTVNTATGIELRAAYINVTKEADTNVDMLPLLRTGVIFDTTVNNGLINAAVKDGRLEAALDSKGKLVIKAPISFSQSNSSADGTYVNITSDNTVTVNGGELAAESVVINASKDVLIGGGVLNATTATIAAGNDLEMTGAALSATAVNMTAGNTLNQTGGSIIAKDTIAKAVKGGLFLRSEDNKLQNVSVEAHNDSVIITSANDEAGELHVTTVGEVGGNLQIDNLQNGVTNDIVIDAKLKSKWNIIVNNKEAGIKIIDGADISASSIYLDAEGDILHDAGNIAADNKVKITSARNIVNNGGAITTEFDDVIWNAKGNVLYGGGSLDTKQNIKITAVDALIRTLNVTNADITVSGKLGIDRLHVVGKGIFTSQGYVTGVHGVVPVHDASNALYYDLGDSTDNGGWMNLYVDGPRDQRSNGLLLHIDTYYHSANQRWSAEDLITKLVDFKPVMSYNAHFGDVYGMFARYNIIELPEEDEEQV